MQRSKSMERRNQSGVRLTVGTTCGDIIGGDHIAIQAAINEVARLGGGKVTLLPGTYVLRNSVKLFTGVTLEGTGPQCILRKSNGWFSLLVEDADWYELAIRVSDASRVKPLDGICLTSTEEGGTSPCAISLHTVLGVDGDTLRLDRYPRENHWVSLGATVHGIHPLLEAKDASEITIANLRLEGNRRENGRLNGNHGAAVCLTDCRSSRIENLEIEDFNGDGISWQTSHDIVVANCRIKGVAGVGLHPGSGSMRPQIEFNTVEDAEVGLFWCWGVRHGTARENFIRRCWRHGISIGHRDTDNAILGNRIESCGQSAIFFRPGYGPSTTAHRCRVIGNTIRCAEEHPETTGVDVCAGVEDVKVNDNVIHIAAPYRACALNISGEAIRPQVEGNAILPLD